MPTYNYRCEKCGKTFERAETISEHETGKAAVPEMWEQERVRGTWSYLRSDVQEELIRRFL